MDEQFENETLNTEVEQNEEVLTAEQQKEVLVEPEDKSLATVTEIANQFAKELSEKADIPLVGIEVDGNNTSVRFKRIPTGYKVIVGLKAFNQTYADFYSRLAHEFVHIVNDLNFEDDTCGNGAYHTEKFKEVAESLFNANITWTRSYGFGGVVEVPNNFSDAEWILPKKSALIVKPKPEPKPRDPNAPKKSGGFKAKIYMITCPDCGKPFYVQKDMLVSQEAFLEQEAKAAKTDEQVLNEALLA
jgi:hypothetical protein